MPNLLVDVDSWRRLACYPRGSFYPLSDGPSIRYHRITKSCFRTCSKCLSRSQAPLCLYTRLPIADRDEGTFERLRYSLGGDRPSQTAHLALFTNQFHGSMLDSQYSKVGIPPMTPSKLTPTLQCLPTILYMLYQEPMLSYSKAPRGLSVLLQVVRICTNSTSSPNMPLRQRHHRCTIRAGRNLPDKEFRYLRTVIVTAAVYWGFISKLRLKD